MKSNLLPQDLPYEKFITMGPEALTDSELLAIIIQSGTRTQNAVEVAGNVLKLSRYPKEGLLGLYELGIDELVEVEGIGKVKAIKLKTVAELSKRLSKQKAGLNLKFNDPVTVAEYFMESMRHRNNECLIMVCLDSKGLMLSETVISQGTVNKSLISGREVFLEALNQKAVSFILVHNHPSGDPTPSRSDIAFTNDILEMGYRLGIVLLDHIIIGDNKYYSFTEMGHFDNQT
ncbi:MAG: DNA repair protein RadC [Lachnospiraceae bacterium]|nr:DNA repair protein RadC [Lachnospiraceae bacterium]